MKRQGIIVYYKDNDRLKGFYENQKECSEALNVYRTTIHRALKKGIIRLKTTTQVFNNKTFMYDKTFEKVEEFEIYKVDLGDDE